MSIKVTLKVDEDFTENDLKVMLASKDYWSACYNIREHVYDMWAGKRDEISTMTTGQVIDDIWKCIKEELHGLPELN